MALSRRRFLTRSGLLAAGGLLGPGLFASPLVRRAMAETLGDRYFVVVFLDGGNDGLNTITPVDDGPIGGLRAAYEEARGTGGGGLRLPASQLLVAGGGAPPMTDPGNGTPLGMHPGLAGLSRLYDRGKVAIVQGCGYPRYSLSHDDARRIWQQASPFGTALPGGWVGRYLAANYGGTDIPAVCMSSSLAGELIQGKTSVLTLDRVRDFGFPWDTSYRSDIDEKRAAFLALCDEAASSAQAELAHAGASSRATLLASETYPALHDLYEDERPTFDAAYDALGSSLGGDFQEIAKVIHGVASGVPNVHARVFHARNGGYDTHSDQGAGEGDGQHTRLQRELGDALEVFYADCEDMGVADKVCVLVWSEFSRRVRQNDNGTDHGSQGPVLVVGGGVQGGVYGSHPDIRRDSLERDGNTRYSQAAGDPFRSTDMRDVYGTILTRWLNMPDAVVRSSVLPVDTGDPGERWTSPNFDLGFLA